LTNTTGPGAAEPFEQAAHILLESASAELGLVVAVATGMETAAATTTMAVAATVAVVATAVAAAAMVMAAAAVEAAAAAAAVVAAEKVLGTKFESRVGRHVVEAGRTAARRLAAEKI